MIHPAFLAIAQQPGLVLDHAGGYAELASAEFDEWSQQVKRRATLSAAIKLTRRRKPPTSMHVLTMSVFWRIRFESPVKARM